MGRNLKQEKTDKNSSRFDTHDGRTIYIQVYTDTLNVLQAKPIEIFWADFAQKIYDYG